MRVAAEWGKTGVGKFGHSRVHRTIWEAGIGAPCLDKKGKAATGIAAQALTRSHLRPFTCPRSRPLAASHPRPLTVSPFPTHYRAPSTPLVHTCTM